MADGETIDRLQIEVEASAKQAQSSIRAFTKDLEALKKKCQGGCGLASVLQEFKDADAALQGSKTHEQLRNLAEALQSLRDVGKVALPKNLSQQITDLSVATAALSQDAIDHLHGLSNGLDSLSQVGKISISSTLGKHLSEIAAAGEMFTGNAETGFANLVAGLDLLSDVESSSISSTLPSRLLDLAIAGEQTSDQALAGIRGMAQAIGSFGDSGGNIPSGLGTKISEIATAASMISPNSVQNLTTLSTGLMALQPVSELSIPSNMASKVLDLAIAAEQAGTVDTEKLNQFAQGLNSLNGIKLSSSLNTQITKLAETAVKLKDTDFSSLTRLNQALQPLANTLGQISASAPQAANALQQLGNQAQSSGQKAQKSTNFWSNFYAKIRLVGVALKSVAHSIASWIDKSNQYIEDVNLFTASMGEYAGEAQKYAEKVGAVMGIDPGAWMRNQGVFNTIITGFGVAGDQAALMSKNLTQLGYDLSSFFNISVDDAMKKLSSGISGELEPLRRLGYDLSVARLQEEALALGITKKVSKMTQAEKSMLRYHAIMTQVTVAQGDMARTLDTPANQIRILKAQVEQCARAFGNVFIPILNKVLPYAIAVANAIRLIAQAIAGLFGFKMPEVDYSGISTAATAAEDLDTALGSGSKKAKKMNELLADWDELNIIASETGGGSGSGAGAGGGGGFADFDLPEYDFLAGLIGSKADEIIQKWQPAIDWIISHLDIVKDAALGIVAALAMWKIGQSFQLGLGKTVKLALGLAIAVDGISKGYRAFTDQWENGVTLENMQTLLLGAGEAALGLFIAFGKTGFAVGLLIGGVALIINPLKEFIETGKMTDEMLGQLSIGILAIGASIALLTGAWIPLVIAAIGVGIAWIVQKWDDIKAWALEIWGNIVSWWNSTVVPAFQAVAEWVNENVVQPVCQFFVDLYNGIVQAIADVGTWWENFKKETIDPAVQWVNTNIVQPVCQFFTDIYNGIVQAIQDVSTWWTGTVVPWVTEKVEWVNTNIVQPVVGFFTTLYNGIVDTINGIPTWWTGTVLPWVNEKVEWVNTAIVQPVCQFFVDIYNGILGAIQDVSTWWTGTVVPWITDKVTWIDTNLIQPILDAFTKIYNGILKDIENVSTWWTTSVVPWVTEKVTWIDTNIVQPVCQFFTNIYNGIVNAINGIPTWWTSTVIPWVEEKVAWVDTNIVQPVVGFFTSIYDGIVAAINGIPEWWTSTVVPWVEEKVAWVDTNIVQPVVAWFTSLYDGIVAAIHAIPEWWTSTVIPWVEEKVAWIDTAIVQPVVGFFTSIYDGIVDAIGKVSTWWTSTVVPWITEKVTWIDTNIVQPVAGFFQSVHDSIQTWLNKVSEEGLFTTIFTDMKTVFDDISKWWTETVQTAITNVTTWVQDNLITPITTKFTEIKTGIETAITDVLTWWETFKTENILPIVEWFNTNIVTPITEAFSGLGAGIQSFMSDPVGSIKTTWEGLSGWFNTTIIMPIQNFFIGMINSIIDGINWIIGKLNSFNFTLGPFNLWDARTIDLGILGQYGIPAFGIPAVTLGISGIPTIEKLPTVETKAEGGFIDKGQMFIARERGAELIGEIGHKTAVANNEQIEEGIASGVRDANQETNDILRELYAVARQISHKRFSLEPSTALARTVKRSEEMRLVTEGV